MSGDEVLPADVYAKLKEEALTQVRGTVQADILKEDQAQNTCIFLCVQTSSCCLDVVF